MCVLLLVGFVFFICWLIVEDKIIIIIIFVCRDLDVFDFVIGGVVVVCVCFLVFCDWRLVK